MKATKFELKLDVEQKLLELEHKQDKKILEEKKEFALFRNENILEGRFNNVEAKVQAEQEHTRTELQVSRVILFNLMYYNGLTFNIVSTNRNSVT
jgi:hypothetical protein